MNFRISDTFTDSLGRLTGDEQKAVKTTAFDLQMNPAHPGLSFHKLDKARDRNFWSVRVGSDLRIIVHKSGDNLLLCYANHHDKAYAWAERRKLETHPTTGAAQWVEIRESVQEMRVPVYVQTEMPVPPPPPKPALYAGLSDGELLSYGVPPDWLADVRAVDADGLLLLAERLPAEAGEALLELATGGKPRPAKSAAVADSPFDHPDAQRRFRVMHNVEELRLALDFPWDKWTVFLHPEQRDGVERDYNGPARVSGSAGTGKTIVALHRAVFLARRNPDARVLLTTFSDPLAKALEIRVRRLIGNEPRLAERLEVHSLGALGLRLHKSLCGPVALVERNRILEILRAAAKETENQKFPLPFLVAEWDHVVDAWQLDTWEAYRDVARLGRKTRLAESQRKLLWSIFERVRSELENLGLATEAGMFHALAGTVSRMDCPPYEFAVVDESQDLGIPQLRFLAALGGQRPNALFFAGDLGQRIFQQAFSWLALGVDIRGRSRTLRINYRTSHQIRSHADRLRGVEVSDADGNTECTGDTVSVFNGTAPHVQSFGDASAESTFVGDWIGGRMAEGIPAGEIALFVRSEAQIPRARQSVLAAGAESLVLDERMRTGGGKVSIATMHLAKGLEFRAVAVMACDDEIIPLQERIEAVGDTTDLLDIYDTERYLLYVACTRARDHLLVTGVEPSSEFLDDLRFGKPARVGSEGRR